MLHATVVQSRRALLHTHGRKSAWLRHVGALAQWRAGALGAFTRVDWARVERLVFLCRGNICRSAYAGARARALGLDAISAGLDARAGKEANRTAQHIAREREIPLSEHVAQPLSAVALGARDLIVAFEPWQARAALKFARSAGAQVTLAGFYSTPLRPHIEDPYGLSENYFRFCFDLIDTAVDSIASKTSSWRRKRRVLVAQAETMGALAVIRSLGRAGYVVHACSQQPGALGFSSRFVSRHAVAPAHGSAEFVDWLRAYVRDHQISAIVPSEGMLLAVEERFEEFAPLFPFSPERGIVYAGMSKYDLFKKFEGEANLPPTLTIDFDDAARLDWSVLQAKLEAMPKPLFIKLDGIYARSGKRKGDVVRVDSAAAALEKLRELGGFSARSADARDERQGGSPNQGFRRAVVQAYVPGRGVGASFVVWGGRVLAGFLHLRLHEVPHTGGISSYRRSLMHEAIRRDAESRVQRLGWQGPVMMEYRWDEKTDRFYLMEMNGRFWGSLHLPMQAGVDFPCVLLDAFYGHGARVARPYADGVRCRYTFPADFQHAWSVVKDAQLSAARRVAAVAKFLVLGFDPRVGSDLKFAGDSKLYWIGLARYARQLFGGPG